MSKLITEWLTDTEKLVRSNDMTFHLDNPDERSEIIAYMKQNSGQGTEGPKCVSAERVSIRRIPEMRLPFLHSEGWSGRALRPELLETAGHERTEENLRDMA